MIFNTHDFLTLKIFLKPLTNLQIQFWETTVVLDVFMTLQVKKTFQRMSLPLTFFFPSVQILIKLKAKTCCLEMSWVVFQKTERLLLD